LFEQIAEDFVNDPERSQTPEGTNSHHV